MATDQPLNGLNSQSTRFRMFQFIAIQLHIGMRMYSMMESHFVTLNLRLQIKYCTYR
jgi:hypothetical protein